MEHFRHAWRLRRTPSLVCGLTRRSSCRAQLGAEHHDAACPDARLERAERRELTGADGKDLALTAAPTIFIGEPGEDDEPAAVAGVSVVILKAEPTVPTVAA